MNQQANTTEEWQHHSQMRPRLRPHVEIHRQHFRGELWYVLQNKANGRFHRVTPAAYYVVGRFDGHKTLEQILEECNEQNGEDAVNRDECMQLLKQLSHSDLLQMDKQVPAEYYRSRLHAWRRMKGWRSLLNPLSVKIPLLDPERFLNSTKRLANLMFGPVGLVIWLIAIANAIYLASIHWQELTTNVTDRVLSSNNLLLLVLVFPAVKVAHELGHGYAVKRWGGEVHEIGIMFLVFMPVPYVDASAAIALRQKHRRMIVGGAGMLVEVFLAALAMILWATVEPGLIRALAFNVIFLASVTTVLFNGNPLLRYDGYYMLSDYLEMPNLGPRANQYIGYLIQRYLFGADPETPDVSRSEKTWLVSFGILSFIYRMFVWTAIILFVATRFFFFGVLLAVWGGSLMILRPLYRMLFYLFSSPRLASVRSRALVVSCSLLVAIIGLLLFLPMPYTRMTEGVVWLPEESVVRASVDGFVTSVAVERNVQVEPKVTLFVMEDVIAMAEVKVLQAQVAELQAEYSSAEIDDLVRAAVVQEHMSLLDSRLQEAQRILDQLTVVSTTFGKFVPVRQGDLEGMFVRKGELLGYVLGDARPTIRTIVNQQDYLLVRDRSRDVQGVFAEDPGKPVQLKLTRQVPAASDKLPSRAFSQAGGGDSYLDPSDSEGNRALQSYFEFELDVLDDISLSRSGGRVYVRFDLGGEPLFWRMYHSARRLFLREFTI